MRVLVTGANGFIGKNLLMRFQEHGGIDVVSFTREQSVNELHGLLEGVDWVFHLAGISRTQDADELVIGNLRLTEQLCAALKARGGKVNVVFSSSIQADQENEYGLSKRAAEKAFLEFQHDTGNSVFVYRLPNVFGKWARPNYNSAVATFCHNVARDLPININDPLAIIRLVYIDDVVDSFMALLARVESASCRVEKTYIEVVPEYKISVGELADQLNLFKATRDNLIAEPVGKGLVRFVFNLCQLFAS